MQGTGHTKKYSHVFRIVPLSTTSLEQLGGKLQMRKYGGGFSVAKGSKNFPSTSLEMAGDSKTIPSRGLG